jgi:hypothetical protein
MCHRQDKAFKFAGIYFAGIYKDTRFSGFSQSSRLGRVPKSNDLGISRTVGAEFKQGRFGAAQTTKCCRKSREVNQNF